MLRKTSQTGNLLYSARTLRVPRDRWYSRRPEKFDNDADPGVYAKWVRCPHGPATVSGYASLGPRTRKTWSLDPPLSISLGKACEADSCRESGNLTTGGVHSSARETP